MFIFLSRFAFTYGFLVWFLVPVAVYFLPSFTMISRQIVMRNVCFIIRRLSKNFSFFFFFFINASLGLGLEGLTFPHYEN